MPRRTFLYCLLSLSLLLASNLPSSKGYRVAAQAQARRQNPGASDLTEEKLAQIKKDFEAGKRLLVRKGVPFEPEELLKAGWQQRLTPKFAEMPEMNLTRRVGRRIHGVQLADVLYLPEKVEITGDTVILARQVIFEGTHALIKGNHNVYFFPVEMEGVLGTTIEAAMIESGVNFLTAGYNKSSSPGRSVPRLLRDGWSITIDTSGPGRKEWLEKQRRTGQINFLKTSSQGGTINHNGADAGGVGNPGTIGLTGANGTPDPAPKGDDGACGEGSYGRQGAQGVAGGTGGRGNDGGIGLPGGDASAIVTTINSTTGDYYYYANGGMADKAEQADKAERAGKGGKAEGATTGRTAPAARTKGPATAGTGVTADEAAKVEREGRGGRRAGRPG